MYSRLRLFTEIIRVMPVISAKHDICSGTSGIRHAPKLPLNLFACWVILHAFLSRNHSHQNVKQFGPRSGSLIRVETFNFVISTLKLVLNAIKSQYLTFL